MPLPSALREALLAHDQSALIEHFGRLSVEDGNRLLADMASLDLPLLARAREDTRSGTTPTAPEIAPPPVIVRGANAAADLEATSLGEQAIRNGRVAAFVVAGGQGTRLGHPGPKGTYPATPHRGKPLFQVFSEKILAASRRYRSRIPLLVMTSPENHEETRGFFAQHHHFGLREEDLRFFSQGTMPAIDDKGQLILASRTSLFRSPDGHGGSLRALQASGVLAWLAKEGIDLISYFQVDNPLVNPVDPLFLGYHEQSGSEFSAKAVWKRNAGEKVGVFVVVQGMTRVIEYSDLPAELREAKDPAGRLKLGAGSVAIHVIGRRFIEALTTGDLRLPFHAARKDIPAYRDEAPAAPIKGTKFETFVFDAMPLAQRTMVMLVPREDEFAPIKNREGEDSPETSRRAQADQFARWLEAAGFAVPRDDRGNAPAGLEISPLVADGPEALRSLGSRIGAVRDGLCLE